MRPNFIYFLVVIVAAILAGRTFLTSGYFVMHDDLQMMRQLEMEKCFLDFQIPCRWVPDMGYGFGFPLFNYYPPLPYLVGQIFRLLGFSFVNTVKLVFLVSFIFSGVTMYFLAKEFFGKLGGTLSAIFYIWAPYHAIDSYVRGAMNESWALIFFPAILWTALRLIKTKQNAGKWLIGLALSWAGLFLSHNLMVLIFTPFFGLWSLFFFCQKKAWPKITAFIKAGFLALALAAFFTIPAAFEQKYVQVNTLITGYYEYIAHFVSLPQLLFSRFWGYGPSIWETKDGMSFQVGHIHWSLSLILAGFVIYRYLRTKKKSDLGKTILLVFFLGWFSVFMAHARSTFIWKLIPPLKFVQFPWRFLTISTLSFSFLAGGIIFTIPKKFSKAVFTALTALLIILNWNYFLPLGGKMGSLTDTEKFTGAAWGLQQTAGIYDYLPVGAVIAPKEAMTSLAEIVDGKGAVSEAKYGTKWAKFKIEAVSDEVEVRVGIFKFPNWKAYLDGKEIPVYISANEAWGRMYLRVPQGQHWVVLKFRNTFVRFLSNGISLIAWLGLIWYSIKMKKDRQVRDGIEKNKNIFVLSIFFMKNFFDRHWRKLLLFFVFFIGFLIRVILVHRVVVGDLLIYLEWGKTFWKIDPKIFYFGKHLWLYSPPNYPPLAILVFAGLDWLWQQKYVIAQIHNLIRLPPAGFIIYFYKYGNFLLYKLVPIISDLGLGFIVFKLVQKLTSNFWKAFGAMIFFVFNPIAVFISGIWGQTDSLVAFLGTLAFVFLSSRKIALSIFFFSMGMGFKPSWGIFIPFYLYALYLIKPSPRSIVRGLFSSLFFLIIVSLPFAEHGVLEFMEKMWLDRYVIPIKAAGKASISAFNFHTIFMKIDRSLFNARYLGFIAADKLGLIIFIILNGIAFKNLKESKNFLKGIIFGLFILGIGSFLFLTNMLERYFFPGLVPLIVIMFTDLRILIWGIIMNLIFLANIIWSFYRRGFDEVDHPFTDYNFFLIRFLSILQVFFFAKVAAKMIQFRRGGRS